MLLILGCIRTCFFTKFYMRQFLSCLRLAEAKHMHYFSGVVSRGINFCQVLTFISSLWQSAERGDTAFCRILVMGPVVQN